MEAHQTRIEIHPHPHPWPHVGSKSIPILDRIGLDFRRIWPPLEAKEAGTERRRKNADDSANIDACRAGEIIIIIIIIR
jgi:hypothetical protein